MKELCADLREEYAALDAFAAELSHPQWEAETPFLGWTVYDQIAHITFIDGQALLATQDVEALEQSVANVSDVLREGGSMPRAIDRFMGGPLQPEVLLERWRTTRTELLKTFEAVDPKTRFPWYGPKMGVRSFATARLMETWAHGQNVYDAVGKQRTCSDRLRHIAHLGVATFGWSFQNRGLVAPEVALRVELSSPSGALWEWGDPEASDRVTGAAEEFCLVVTRRRHVLDTALVREGEVARRWMEIAQCFAGPVLDAPEPTGAA